MSNATRRASVMLLSAVIHDHVSKEVYIPCYEDIFLCRLCHDLGLKLITEDLTQSR